MTTQHVTLHWKEFGEWLREQRIAAGLTQLDLANRLCVTTTVVSRIENGHRELTPESLIQLADAMNVDIAEILKLLLGKKF